MIPLDAELQHLEEIYDAVERDLQRQSAALGPEPWFLSDQYHPDMPLQQVEEAGRLVEQVRQTWHSRGPKSEDRALLAGRVAYLRDHLQRLLALAEDHAAKFRQLKSATCQSLEKLQSGAQFLQSTRPYKENRPKFIDARQ